MVDWDLVDRRRAKGWDWERIADDPKVGFHADESAGDPGRALRALYYQRRSKAKRRSGDPGVPGGAEEGGTGAPLTSPLARVGFLLTPLFGIWLLLALLFPSRIGTIGGSATSAIPYIGILLAIGAFLLGFGLLRSIERWTGPVRVALTIGVVLGLVVSGGVALTSALAGCPNLSTNTTGEPVANASWFKAANPDWTVNGAPVFFYYGSVACPFCSASSWAMWYALQQFGTWHGVTFSHSSPSDSAGPSTPSVDLSAAGLTSPYVATLIFENSDPNTIRVPAVGCPESTYVSTYDSGGGIPFVVINGQFVHSGTLVDPTQLRQTPGDLQSPSLTPQQVLGEINNGSGAAWNAISVQATVIEAMFVIANHGGGPPSVVNDPQVRADEAQIH